MPGPSGFFAGSSFQDKPRERVLPQCGACGIYKKCHTPKMAVGGAGGARVLFVGGGPDAEEDRAGRHFTGRGGRRLRQVLKRLGFDLERDAWMTNAVICAPPKGRAATTPEVIYCRPNITRTIRELKPDVIVPMGIAAVNAVLGPVWDGDMGKMDRWHGWRIPCHKLNAWVCPTWAPVDVATADDMIMDRMFDDHIANALACPGVPYPNGPPDYAADVQIITDPAVAARWLRKAATMQTGAVAWDYEANCLKAEGDEAEIVSCAVTWGRTRPERTIAYPWHGEAIQATQELLRSPIPKIASNLKFEDRWTRKEFGHRVRGWAWDTMLAAHILDNRPHITSVKFQAFVRLGVPVWNQHIEPFLKTRGDQTVNKILAEVTITDLLTYNGLDALLEWHVAWDQLREMGRTPPWNL